jgi:hypothetical protein
MRPMTTRMILFVALLSVLGSALACDKGSGDPGSSESKVEAAPTKDNMVATLKKVHAALAAKDYKKAVGFFALPKGMDPAKAEKAVSRLIEKNEISEPGIDILAAKGTFGKLSELAPDKGKRRADRAGVPLEECYVLAFEEAEVMAHWDGSSFKIFRLDDVGKLK